MLQREEREEQALQRGEQGQLEEQGHEGWQALHQEERELRQEEAYPRHLQLHLQQHRSPPPTEHQLRGLPRRRQEQRPEDQVGHVCFGRREEGQGEGREDQEGEQGGG